MAWLFLPAEFMESLFIPVKCPVLLFSSLTLVYGISIVRAVQSFEMQNSTK